MNSFEEWINQIEIIDHNEHFLVLYKPEGLSFYEDSPKPDLMKILRYMDQNHLLPEGEKLFPIHRIDKITSGILVFARGRKATNILSNHFRHHRIQKIYLALSNEKPQKKTRCHNRRYG